MRIKALISFNDVKAGDTAELEHDDRVQGWIDAGLVAAVKQVVGEARALRPIVEPGWVTEIREARRGESEAGQGTAESADDERVESGAERSEPAGGEPGQSFGAGPYGAPA